MSDFWHWTVIIVVTGHIVAYLWLLFATAKKKVDKREDNTTGHVWDEDLTELDHPMPRWWLWLFVITIVFAVIYLYQYPGLGNYKGSKEWTSINRFETNYAAVSDARDKSFAGFINKPIDALIQDDQAMLIGQRIFANHCAQCHASDAQGNVGFPNLTDADWNWGGEHSDIVASISNGRMGVMPAFAPALGEAGTQQVAAYVRSLSGIEHDATLAAEGATKFGMFCAACHGADAQGQKLFGAPNLTDDIWLYGSDGIIETALYEGLSGNMPSQQGILDENRIKLVAAYVYSLSKQ
ncbi:cytochrome-c oxidase, cbb3-type subunit III [Marinicella litoralis]|uniref:Cbb3-type cytochrome c oxidase subunit n=1 Tax=Marinicella litoralis TaxID=644220 RepID=A0A4R6XZ58_9GAMM|nr:cytochrome-c oxidase, cbb3-type subunit III [Marinicella litoralis]TDR23830.1 cytochrome c oxidase cbb3-type subunit 3 [Marinicella litoralis]